MLGSFSLHVKSPYEKKRSAARASHFLVQFFDVHCMTSTTWEFLIYFTFHGGREHTTTNFLFYLEFGYSPFFQIKRTDNSRKIAYICLAWDQAPQWGKKAKKRGQIRKISASEAIRAGSRTPPPPPPPVEPPLSGYLLRGYPLLSGQYSKSRNNCRKEW